VRLSTIFHFQSDESFGSKPFATAGITEKCAAIAESGGRGRSATGGLKCLPKTCQFPGGSRGNIPSGVWAPGANESATNPLARLLS
jgi:hypothetical protein